MGLPVSWRPDLYKQKSKATPLKRGYSRSSDFMRKLLCVVWQRGADGRENRQIRTDAA